MQPDKKLEIQSLYELPRNEWIDLTPYVTGFIQFPAPGMTINKTSMAEAAQSINRYPAAAVRINSDGLVLMRGLLRTSGGGNIATGNDVINLPIWLAPKFPQELRMFGGTCVLKIDPQTNKLQVDIIFSATSWVNLGNVMYYLD